MLLRSLPILLCILIGLISVLITKHLMDTSGPSPKRYTMRSPENLVLIPSGRYEKGLSSSQMVQVGAFYMGRYDVTNAAYCRFLNDAIAHNHIKVKAGRIYLSGNDTLLCETAVVCPSSRIAWNGVLFSVCDRKENHPMVCVRWEGAAAYCNWLSIQEGYPVCYDLQTWKCDFNACGFRLPAENEWVCAAYGNLTHQFSQHDVVEPKRSNRMDSGDPYEAGPSPWTTPVGFYTGGSHSKEALNWPGEHSRYQTGSEINCFGLSDMTGNVLQWGNEPGPNPDTKPIPTWYGGSWKDKDSASPDVQINVSGPDSSYSNIGFRVVLPVKTGMEPVSHPACKQEGITLTKAR